MLSQEPHRTDALREKVYVELVRSLYANFVPAVIMSLACPLCFVLISQREGNALTMVSGAAAIIASITRLAVTGWFRHRALTAVLTVREARRLELAFALPFMSFALCLGAYISHVFSLPDPEAHMLCICLVVAYCAGVATGAGLRPFIAVPSMMVAIIPTIVVAVGRADPIYVGLGVILSAFLFGGLQTVLARQSMVIAEVGKRLTFGSLALSDNLTALPNRLALREYFSKNSALISTNGLIAVHYLDLDGFKPVNDRYGHSTGDALLAAVAERLVGAIRNGDIVARLGGDEFGIVQFGLRRPDEAQLLVQRIKAAISAPFQIKDNVISISASVGTTISVDRSCNLDQLLLEADERLYVAKRARSSARKAAA